MRCRRQSFTISLEWIQANLGCKRLPCILLADGASSICLILILFHHFPSPCCPCLRAVKSPGNMAVKSPDNMAVKSPDNMAVKSPDNMAVKSPDNMAVKSPDNMAVKSPDNMA